MYGKLKILLLSLCFCTGCAVNPITGESQLMLFPEEQDIEIGKSYAPEIEEQMGGKVENLAVQNYLDSVGQNLAQVSHKPPYFDYHFIPLEDDSVNAFALPGGYVLSLIHI